MFRHQVALQSVRLTGGGSTHFSNVKGNDEGGYKVDARRDEADVKPEIWYPTHIGIHILLSNNMPTFPLQSAFAATLRYEDILKLENLP